MLVVAIAILGAMGAIGQNRKISGTVTTGEGLPLKDVKVWLKSSPVSTLTDRQGKYFIEVPLSGGILAFTRVGFEKKEVKVGGSPTVDVVLSRQRADVAQAEADKDSEALPAKKSSQHSLGYALESAPAYYQERQPLDWNTEEYDAINENIFHSAMQSPLSTFSIDVDAASYSNVRRFINNGQQPPRDAVRIEEMINYFSYDYPAPEGRDPFAIYTEVSSAPWNPAHRLVHIGLQGKKVPTEHLPPSNLVFLIDVSGSMSSANKLPLLKASFKLLVKQLRAQDRVAMVVYAGGWCSLPLRVRARSNSWRHWTTSRPVGPPQGARAYSWPIKWPRKILLPMATTG